MASTYDGSEVDRGGGGGGGSSQQKNGGRCYPIRNIIGVHIDENNQMFYQVQWEPTWEPSDNLIGCDSLVKEFWCRVHPATVGCHVKQERMENSLKGPGDLPVMLPNVMPQNNKNNVSLNNGRDVNRPLNYRRSSRIAVTTSSSATSSNPKNIAARAMKSSGIPQPLKFNPPPPVNRIVFPTGFRTRRRPPPEASSMSSLNLSTADDSFLLPSQSDKASSVSDVYQMPSCSYSGFVAKSDTNSMYCGFGSSDKTSGEEDEIMMNIERKNEHPLSREDEQSNDYTTREEKPFTKIFELQNNNDNCMTDQCETKYTTTMKTEPRNHQQNRVRNLLTPFSCHMCAFRSCEKNNLQRHFFNKHSLNKKNIKLTFPCKMCDKIFKGKAYLQTHLVSRHSQLDSTPYKCSACALSFASVHELEGHHITHEYDLEHDPYEIDSNEPKDKAHGLLLCSKCSLGFDSKAALEKHKRRHIEILNPFPPPPLPSARSRKSNVSSKKWRTTKFQGKHFDNGKLLKANASKIKAKYRRTMVSLPRKGQKNVAVSSLLCPYCPSKFTLKNGVGIANLNTHLVMKHQDKSSARNVFTDLHKCPLCVKMFISERSLRIHAVKKHEISEDDVTKKIEELKNTEVARGHVSATSDKRRVVKTKIGRKRDKTYPRRHQESENKINLQKATLAVERKARVTKRVRRYKALIRKRVTTASTSPVRLDKNTTEANVEKNTSLENCNVPQPRDCDQQLVRKRGRGRPPSKLRCVYCGLKLVNGTGLATHERSCKKRNVNNIESGREVPPKVDELGEGSKAEAETVVS